MQELLALYRFALRSGDDRLAEALARATRSDAALRRRADFELQELPRGPARRFEGAERAAAERAVAGALRRIGSARP
ncbi:MAG TPA: hypothetical protein VG126_03945 [Thermoleophilaceae bacterium]|nr:hypothetical protein [Thermoleophilaceae bacterium]